jgi:hypothetical protein
MEEIIGEQAQAKANLIQNHLLTENFLHPENINDVNSHTFYQPIPPISTPPNCNYEQDFIAWCEHTISKLNAGDFDSLDIENLIEELAGLAGRDRREIRSRLIEYLSHLLKRRYISMPTCFRGWEKTIENQSDEINQILHQSPSLKTYLAEILSEVWNIALKRTQKEYPKYTFSSELPFTSTLEITNLLDRDRPWETLTNETI